jgi:hypothetical protein
MGHFVEGEDRRQSFLLPQSLDDYVTEDNPVGSLKYLSTSLILADLALPVFIRQRRDGLPITLRPCGRFIFTAIRTATVQPSP